MERSGMERNWSNGTQFAELYCSEKGSRVCTIERKTVNYSYYIVNIITNLQSMLKKGRNAHMQASNAGNNYTTMSIGKHVKCIVEM